jgi:hypothetical protein
MIQRHSSLPLLPSLARHPMDGWQLSQPLPLGKASRAALMGLVDALLPPAPAPRPVGIEERVATHVRRMLQYMPPALRWGFVLLVHLIDWSPLWRGRGLKPLHALPVLDASERIKQLGESRLAPLRLMLLAPKACILSTYFDQDEVHEALGYDPKSFMRERIERRRALLRAVDAQLVAPSRTVATEQKAQVEAAL